MKKTFGVFSVIVGTGILFYERILSLYLKVKYLKGFDSSASSVAIIGGADGPTAIFVSSSTPSVSINILKYVLGGFFIFLGVFLWNKQKKDSRI
jgi:Na+-transporting methylmalonyl-CoA/oxaloacetate decarboxylase beta subunit